MKSDLEGISLMVVQAGNLSITIVFFFLFRLVFPPGLDLNSVISGLLLEGSRDGRKGGGRPSISGGDSPQLRRLNRILQALKTAGFPPVEDPLYFFIR